MGLTDGGAVKFTNLGFRVLQFLIAIPILAIYANQKMWQNGRDEITQSAWEELLGNARLNLGIAAGVIGMISALLYAGAVFFLDFIYIAWAFLWDMIVMILYAALFAETKKRMYTGDKERQDVLRRFYDGSRVDLMSNVAWVDLVAMLLWVCTFLMGIVVLVLSRFRGSKPVY